MNACRALNLIACFLDRLPLIHGSRWLVVIILLLSAGLAQAAEIYVDGVSCQLSDAIVAANTDAARFGCSAGAGADTLILLRDIKLQFGNLPSISSDITIETYLAEALACGGDDVPPDTPNDPPDGPSDPPGTPDTPNDPPGTPDDPPDTPNDPPDTPNDPPDTPNVPPNTPNVPPDVPPDTPNIPPDTPNVPPDTPNVPPDTPNVPPDAPNIPPDTPNVPPDAPNIPPDTPNVPPDAPNVPPGAQGAPPIPSHCLHVVARNENLYRISLLYDMTVREISSFNGLVSDDNLIEGQGLIIPYDECLQYAGLKG